jgi:hypothetical protein
VANLSVTDALGETPWSYTQDYPELYVSWDADTEEDLASTPYEVFISDFEPQSIDDMEKVKSTSDTSLYIKEYGGKSLVYGKNYWVAAIARDKAGNYNNCFVAICGPVQTYEDMNITLDQGWNLKSVPMRLLASNSSPESVFGKASTVFYWNGQYWEFPEVIEPCKGYWIYSPEAFENNIKFKPMSSDSTEVDAPASLNLTPGWQMIGSTSTQPVAWSSNLASLKNPLIDYKFSNIVTYSHSEGWRGIIPELGPINTVTESRSMTSGGALISDSDPRPVGTLQNKGMMVPGQGYWVFMTNEGTYASSESAYNFQNPSESDVTTDDGNAVDVPIVDGTDDGTAVDVTTDDGTAVNVTTDDGKAVDVTTDGGTAVDVTTDDGTAVDVTTDDGTAVNVTTDDGKAVDVTTDDGTAVDVTTDDGTAVDVTTDDGKAVDVTTDNGATDVPPT